MPPRRGTSRGLRELEESIEGSFSGSLRAGRRKSICEGGCEGGGEGGRLGGFDEGRVWVWREREEVLHTLGFRSRSPEVSVLLVTVRM